MEGDRKKQISRVTHCCNTFFLFASWERFRWLKWGKAVVLKGKCLHQCIRQSARLTLTFTLSLEFMDIQGEVHGPGCVKLIFFPLGHGLVKVAIRESHHCRISGRIHSCFKTKSSLMNGLLECRRNLCLLHASISLFSSGNWAFMSCVNVPLPFHFTNDFLPTRQCQPNLREG